MRFISSKPFVAVKNSTARTYTRVKTFVANRPFPSFIVLLALLFLVIVVGSRLRKPEQEVVEPEKPAKEVTVYTYGGQPSINVVGKVEKSGIINIVAQSAGVVQKINITEGKSVKRGTSLLNMSTNYQGGSLPRASTQIATQNYKFNKETYDIQKQIIAKNRELAEKGEIQGQELRDITRIIAIDSTSWI